MASKKIPGTSAVRELEAHRIPYALFSYRYEEKGGTRVAAHSLGVDEHRVIKTLVMETEEGDPFLLLMHGDRHVSTKALARLLGAKRVVPSSPDRAHKVTGYLVGGVSPFGTRKALRLYMEASIIALPEVYINAGRRGLMARISPQDLDRSLKPVHVKVATS